jgi:4-amino-4-deoxychorismate lyase
VTPRPAILVNGVPAKHVAADDRGLHYGDGLFETIAVIAGEPRRWMRHMARLESGCARLGIPTPDTGAFLDDARTLCAGRDRAVLKLIVTRGRGGRGYRPPSAPQPTRIAVCSNWPEWPARIADEGARVRYCRMRLGRNPVLAGIKHLSRLEYVLARAEWGNEYDEGLLRDDAGNVVEGTVSNVFAVSRGALYTPDLSQCGVAGIMREAVMEQAQRLGLAVHTRPMTRDDIAQADELLLTNSLHEVWPVTQLEKQHYGVGPLTRRLMESLRHE